MLQVEPLEHLLSLQMRSASAHQHLFARLFSQWGRRQQNCWLRVVNYRRTNVQRAANGEHVVVVVVVVVAVFVATSPKFSFSRA